MGNIKWNAGMFTKEHAMGIPASHILGMLPGMGAIYKIDGNPVLANRGTHSALITLHSRARPRMRLDALSDQDVMGLNNTQGVIRKRPGTGWKNHLVNFEMI